MPAKRKRESTTSTSGLKKQRRSAKTLSTPAPSREITKITAVHDASILNLPAEILTQILSYILAKSKEPITLHSASGRRWRNEVHALVGVDWNHNINVLPTVLRRDLRLTKKSTKSLLLDNLLVCRSFYFAGTAAFFGENVLKFETVRHLERLTATLDLDRRRCIRSILFHSLFHTGVLWDKDLVALAERLGICFDRLPSLQTVKIVYQISNHGPEWHASTLSEKFERVKEFCRCKPQLLSFELRNADGAELNKKRIVVRDEREALVSESRTYGSDDPDL